MMKTFEAPDGDVLCESCINDSETAKWLIEDYIRVAPQPDEICDTCGTQLY